jgi:hypothetical protein
MPWVRTPEASQEPRPHGCCASAFPVGRAGLLLRYGSISGLFIPFTGVPAYGLPVDASPGTLPYPTQDSVPDCWLGFVRVVISDDWTFCACKAQLPHHRTDGSRLRRFGRLHQGEPSPQPEHRFPACQQRVHPRCRARSPTLRRMPSRRSTPGHDSCPPFRPSAHPRCGLASPWPRLSALGCLTSVACAGPVGSEEARPERRWPPSAAQTARAVLPHAACTKARPVAAGVWKESARSG